MYDFSIFVHQLQQQISVLCASNTVSKFPNQPCRVKVHLVIAHVMKRQHTLFNSFDCEEEGANKHSNQDLSLRQEQKNTFVIKRVCIYIIIYTIDIMYRIYLTREFSFA